MNFIMDKARARQAWGGPTIGAVANHIVPDTLFNNLLADYAPYKTPGDHGSVAKAKAAMKGSKYDTSRTARAAPRQCKNVLLIADTRAVDTKMLPRDRSQTRRRSASPSRRGRSKVPTRRSRPRRRTSRSPSAPAGARTTPTRNLLQPAVRRSHDHPARQHELLAPRHHAGAGKTVKVKGNWTNRMSRASTRISTTARPCRPAAHRLLREPRQEADDEGRAVGPVPVVEGDPHHEQQRHEVRVRPVRARRPPTHTSRSK